MHFYKIKTMGDMVADIGYKYFTTKEEKLIWSEAVIQLFELATSVDNRLLKTFCSLVHNSAREKVFHKRRGRMTKYIMRKDYRRNTTWISAINDYISDMLAYRFENENSWFWTSKDAERNKQFIDKLQRICDDISNHKESPWAA